MSIVEIDDQTYDQIKRETVERYRKHGYELHMALTHATDLMQHCFRRRTTSLQCEYEADYAEYIDDMSLGGETYKVER